MNGSEIGSCFLSELSDRELSGGDRELSWLGVDSYGGCLVLEAFPKILDGRN